jgi:hypothetical protein
MSVGLNFSPVPTDGVALLVVDYRTVAASTPAAAGGTCSVTLDPVPAGYFWLVERITVLNTSSTATTAYVYEGDPAPGNFRDGTSRGNLDVADESSPILVDSTRYLTVLWTGASNGAVGTVTVQYQLVKRA